MGFYFGFPCGKYLVSLFWLYCGWVEALYTCSGAAYVLLLYGHGEGTGWSEVEDVV